jgi:hypothetical protein
VYVREHRPSAASTGVEERAAKSEKEGHLVVEPSGTVKKIEVVLVRFRPPEVHVRDFEVGPNYVLLVWRSSVSKCESCLTVAEVIRLTIVGNEGEGVVLVKVLWKVAHKVCGAGYCRSTTKWIARINVQDKPCVVSQSVGIVTSHSMSEIVQPEKKKR